MHPYDEMLAGLFAESLTPPSDEGMEKFRHHRHHCLRNHLVTLDDLSSPDFDYSSIMSKPSRINISNPVEHLSELQFKLNDSQLGVINRYDTISYSYSWTPDGEIGYLEMTGLDQPTFAFAKIGENGSSAYTHREENRWYKGFINPEFWGVKIFEAIQACLMEHSPMYFQSQQSYRWN